MVIGMKKYIGAAAFGVIGTAFGAGFMKRKDKREIARNREMADQNKNMSEKHLALFLLMNQWVNLKQEGKNLASYFEKKGYHRIAIYGMSYAGCTFYDELLGSDIEIAYLIDRNEKKAIGLGKGFGAKFVSMDETLEEVDAIVVTPITFFDEIERNLREKVKCPVVSLKEIINEV